MHRHRPGTDVLLAVTGAAGAALEVSFDRPVELAKIGITPGTPEDFLAEPRPSRLHVVFSDGAVMLSVRAI